MGGSITDLWIALRCRIADWRMRREMLRVLFSEEADWDELNASTEENAHEESTHA